AEARRSRSPVARSSETAVRRLWSSMVTSTARCLPRESCVRALVKRDGSVAAPGTEPQDEPHVGREHDRRENDHPRERTLLRVARDLGHLLRGFGRYALELRLVERAVLAEEILVLRRDLRVATRKPLLDRLLGGLFLLVADQRGAEDADAEHTDPGDSVERERTAARGLLRDDAESRWPEEGFCKSVQRGGGEDRDQPLCLRQPVKSDDRQGGAGGEQAERGEFVHDRAGEEAQHHHDRGGVDQDPQRLVAVGAAALLHLARDGAIGAKFRRRQ